jgi:formate dehydrogenase subunit gamma
VDIPLQAEIGRSLTPGQRRGVLAAVAANRHLDGALLPVLHAVQKSLGHVPPDAVPLIAHELNLSRAEVHGVLSFYHWFRTSPPGRTVVHLCRAEACQSLGAGRLEAHAKQALGIDFHGTTPDGAVTLEPVYCLGNCSLGPSLLVDQRLHGRVTPERFDALVADLRK